MSDLRAAGTHIGAEKEENILFFRLDQQAPNCWGGQRYHRRVVRIELKGERDAAAEAAVAAKTSVL